MRTWCRFMWLASALSASSATAHHSVPVNFDLSREILIKGTLIEVKWLNPHTHWLMEVETSDGTTERWLVEHGSVNAMRRSNFVQYMDLFTEGTEVTVVGAPGRRERTMLMRRTEVMDGDETICVGTRGQLEESCVPEQSTP